MKSKGFELSISTIVILAIAILVLIGLAFIVARGFTSFNSGTKPFLDTSTATSVKQACTLACDNQDKLTYCCQSYEVDKQQIACNDNRLEVPCDLVCEGFSCT